MRGRHVTYYIKNSREEIMTTSTQAVSEHNKIAQTIQIYVEAGRSGRGDDMKAAFHPDATIFGYAGPQLFAGPIQKLFDWNDQNGPATGLQANLASVDIAGTIAPDAR